MKRITITLCGIICCLTLVGIYNRMTRHDYSVVVPFVARTSYQWHRKEARVVLSADLSDLEHRHDVCVLNTVVVFGQRIREVDRHIPSKTRRNVIEKTQQASNALARELTWRIRQGRYLDQCCVSGKSSLIDYQGKYNLHIDSEYWTIMELNDLIAEQEIVPSVEIASKKELHTRYTKVSLRMAREFARRWRDVCRGQWCDTADNLLIIMHDDRLDWRAVGLSRHQRDRLNKLGRENPSPFRTPD